MLSKIRFLELILDVGAPDGSVHVTASDATTPLAMISVISSKLASALNRATEFPASTSEINVLV